MPKYMTKKKKKNRNKIALKQKKNIVDFSFADQKFNDSTRSQQDVKDAKYRRLEEECTKLIDELHSVKGECYR